MAVTILSVPSIVRLNERQVSVREPVNLRHPLNMRLVSWWKILPHTKGGLTLYDLRRLNEGTLTNMDPATDWVVTSRGHALAFDGANDFVDVPSLTWTPTSFTLSFWLFALSRSDFNQNINAVNGWGSFVFHTTNTGGIFVGIDIPTRFTPTDLPSNTLTLNSWIHFVYTLDGGEAAFYKNGDLLASKTQVLPSAWGGFLLGNSSTGTINGNLDDIRIYDRDLSASEVYALYIDSLRGSPNTLNSIQPNIFIVSDVSIFEQTITDAFTFNDSAASVIDFDRSLAEAINLTDVHNGNVDFPRSLIEAIGITDVPASVIDFPRSIAEAVDLTDVHNGNIDVPRSIAEAIEITDAHNGSVGVSRSLTEAIAITDVSASVIDFLRSITEGIGQTDVDDSIIDFIRSLVEGVTLDDTASTGTIHENTLTESFTFSDVVNGLLTVFLSLTEGFTEDDSPEASVARPSPYIFPVGKLEVLDILKAVQRPESLGLKKIDIKRIVEELLFVSVKGESNFRIVAESTTVTIEDQIVYIDASLENITITLPTEIIAIGRKFWLRRVDNVSGNTVSITPNIDGALQTLLVDESFTIHSDGTAYRLI